MSYNTPIRFDGDIIITDPCYIINHDRDDKTPYPDIKDYISKVHYRTDEAGATKLVLPKPEDYPDCRTMTTDDIKNESDRINYFMSVQFTGKPPMYSETLERENAAYEMAYVKYSREYHDDWQLCGYGDDMGKLGFTTFLSGSTIYGDWSCTTFNSDTNEILGRFCADAGQVAVFLLDEVLKYNPGFDYHINRLWTTTLIRDFHGTVELHVDEDADGEREVTVVGRGNISFVGRQTGF